MFISFKGGQKGFDFCFETHFVLVYVHHLMSLSVLNWLNPQDNLSKWISSIWLLVMIFFKDSLFHSNITTLSNRFTDKIRIQKTYRDIKGDSS